MAKVPQNRFCFLHLVRALGCGAYGRPQIREPLLGSRDLAASGCYGERKTPTCGQRAHAQSGQNNANCQKRDANRGPKPN